MIRRLMVIAFFVWAQDAVSADIPRGAIEQMPYEEQEHFLIDHFRNLSMTQFFYREGGVFLESDETLEAFLKRELRDDISFHWSVDDCGEGGDRPPVNIPICVSIDAYLPECPRLALSFIVLGKYSDFDGKASYWHGGIEGFGGWLDINRYRLDEIAPLWREAVSNQVEAAKTFKEVDPEAVLRYAMKIPAKHISPELPDLPFLDWLTTVMEPYQVQAHLPERIVLHERECRSANMWVTFTTELPKRRVVRATLHIGNWQQGITDKLISEVSVTEPGRYQFSTKDLLRLRGEDIARFPKLVEPFK